MTADPHTLAGAYALNALDLPEHLEFEAHLRSCPDCADEVAGLVATAAVLGMAESVAVPASLHDAVMAQVRASRQLTPIEPVEDTGVLVPLLRRARTTSRAAMGVAAALIVVTGGLGAMTVHEHQQSVQMHQMADGVSSVLAAADARQIAGNGDQARAIVSASLGRAVFVPRALPPVDDDHVLQLWVMQDGYRSVGLIHGGSPLVADGIRPGTKFGVTVEPAGGSKQPTTAPMLTMPLA